MSKNTPPPAHPEEGLSLAKARLEGRLDPSRRHFDKLNGSSG